MSYGLSFKNGNEGKAIAIIKGGKLNNKVVYLVKNESGNDLSKSIDYDDIEEQMVKLKIKQRDRVKIFVELETLFESGTKPEDVVSTEKHLKELYASCYQSKNNTTSLKLDIGSKFEILPSSDKKKSSRYYICGMSECGKSYIAKQIIEQYNLFFPKRKIYVISKLKKDETLDSCKCKLTRINPDIFLDEIPTIEEFSNDGEGCLIVCDDYDNFKGKLGKIIQTFIDDICQLGRHENISCVLCTHFLTNYATSSIKLSECQYYVIFPQGATSKKLSYLLESYAGISDVNTKLIKSMGRWVLISRCHPQYAISESEILIFNQKDN